MKIIAKLQGGLGNQMFEYAFARKLQLMTRAELILDTSDFKYDGAGRTYALEPFNIDKSSIVIDSSGKYNIKYDQRSNWFIKAGVKFAPSLLFDIFSKHGIYIWEDIKYRDFTPDFKKNVIYLHGLWQSAEYFKGYENEIKNELRVITPVSEIDSAIICEMKKTESVALHIRRGDFLKKSNNLAVCSEKYFLDAMDYIEKRVEKPVFYAFSDDIDDVKRSFNFSNKNVVYVEGKREDFEEFRLMYSARHFITSNSTFSWWTSFLGEGGGIVVSPRKWYEDKTDISNLLRDDMICI